MLRTKRECAGITLAVGLALHVMAEDAAAKTYAYLGAGPTEYSRDRGNERGIGMGLAACATLGGAASFLMLGQFDRLNEERFPVNVLVGLRAQASKGPSPYVDFGVGVKFDRGESGFGTTVGAGYHGVQSGPGWFADLHYLVTGNYESTSTSSFQLRFGVSTP